MKWIRAALGQMILFLDAIFSPRPLRRSQDLQKRVDIEKPDGNVEWMPESSDINAYLHERFADYQ